MFRLSLLLATCLVIASACTRERFSFSSDAQPTIGIDTLHFDTLFTQSGSKTFHFLVHNNNSSGLRISRIEVAGGQSGYFHLNVNGIEGPAISDIDIAPNDSAHVFVNAFIPNSATQLPFVITDSIGIHCNGQIQWVQLEAWAQNAHYIKNGVINSNTNWKGDLPYVIIGPLQVTTAATLTIEPGARIYCHADAAIQIDGSLQALGDSTESNRILFTGDRLDAPYQDYPATWPGIRFGKDSRENLLQYVSIRNAYRGITLDAPLTSWPSLILEQTEIRNMLDAGLFASGAYIRANNSVFLNCGRNVHLEYGGQYFFTQCTIATFSNNYFAHKEPVVYISDSKTENGHTETAALTAIFTNTIVWGESDDVPNEFVADRQGADPFTVQFNNGIWKMATLPDGYNTVGTLSNADPLFISTGKFHQTTDLHLQSGSPAIGLGTATGIRIDYDGRPRSLINPSTGAFEQQ
ncbi:MAG TPA: hypothetical protein PKJ36_08110 [Flavihumibacter sp.]|nr:hypothetical protein [Flavihumibacter sp.]